MIVGKAEYIYRSIFSGNKTHPINEMYTMLAPPLHVKKSLIGITFVPTNIVFINITVF